MRPGGPGLVVMALAFISGARRGTSQQSTPAKGGKLEDVGDDSTGSLARVNPWLSACDLAQPNIAPDLQVNTSFKHLSSIFTHIHTHTYIFTHLHTPTYTHTYIQYIFTKQPQNSAVSFPNVPNSHFNLRRHSSSNPSHHQYQNVTLFPLSIIISSRVESNHLNSVKLTITALRAQSTSPSANRCIVWNSKLFFSSVSKGFVA